MDKTITEINAEHLHALTVACCNKWQDGEMTTSEYVKQTGRLLDMAVLLNCERAYESIKWPE